MRFLDLIEYAVKNLRSQQLRSWLTITGIVIGVIAMVVITSVTEGISKEVTDLMSTFSADKMFVVPINLDSGSSMSFSGGQQSMGKLYQRDVDSINSVPGVEDTARLVYGRSTISFRDKEITTPVYAGDSNVFTIFSDFFQIEQGRAYTDAERRSVILGYDAANSLFGKDKIGVGNTILINGKQFKVVAILKDLGGGLMAHDNSVIFVPFDEGTELFPAQLAKNEVTAVYIKLSEGYDPLEVKSTIEQKIASNHHVTIDNKDFTVVTSDFIQKTVGTILDTLSKLLFAITAVATVVGGIGITNTMFMAVLERIREIGILKSIGASNQDIQLIFLTESAFIGLVGGLIGFAIAVAFLFIGSQFGLPYLIRIRWVVFVFVFSALVGIIAGFIPARQAAKMDPVEALRYE
jgi:putative ABC transport system permease protein